MLLLGGCGTGVLNTNQRQDAGGRPVKYEETLRAYLYENLNDPESLRDFSAGEPLLTNCSIGIYGPFWAWRVEAKYNAKNKFGGYVGRSAHYFWFHGDGLKGVTESPDSCPQASVWKGVWSHDPTLKRPR
jgi:hypothetical protein